MSRFPRWFAPLLITFTVFLMVGLTQKWGPIERLENLTRDWRFVLRGVQNPKTPLTIISIDDKTLATPALSAPLIFWGEHHAKVFQSLHDMEAKAVGFDMVQPLSLSGYIEPNPDQKEAEVLAQMPEMVLSFTRTIGLSGKIAETLPNDQLRTAVALGGGRLGFANTAPDADGVVRAFLPVDDDKSLSFAMELASVATASEATITKNAVKLGQRSIPLDENGRCIIDFIGPDKTFSRISFADFLAQPEKYRSQIKDHICLIGTTSTDLQDQHLAPFAPAGQAGRIQTSGQMAGVELQANIVSTLLSGGVYRVDTRFSWLLIAIALALSTPWCWLNRTVWVAPALLFLILAWLTFCFAAFSRYNWQLPMVAVLLAIALNGFSLILLRLRRESRRKQHIEDVFGRYVSQQVVHHLLDVPGAAELGGRRQIVTVLFSDIRGFTTQSEQMEPEQVTSFLNNYLAQMVEIIFANGGTVDKYLGDGIMALWNWPIDQPDHARRATVAAIEMQRYIKESAAEWENAGFKNLRIGIGIHTGPAVAGNVGSPRRMERTAIGDTINTASRLEGLTKEWGTEFGDILLSGATKQSIESAPDEWGQTFEMQHAGEASLRGRQEQLEVFAIISKIQKSG